MRTKRLLRLVFVATLVGSAARAGQITFTMTANVTGTLGATPFTDALVTVTSVADTSNVFVAGGSSPDFVYELIATSSTVSIAGVTAPGSPATFTGTTFWEDPNGSGDIIFGVPGGAGFFNGVLGFGNFSLTFYQLDSSIGPISGNDFEVAVFDAFENIPTSAGLLSIPQASNSVTVNGLVTQDFTETFTAVTAVPEPTPIVLLLGPLAFTCLIGFRKAQRFKKPA